MTKSTSTGWHEIPPDVSPYALTLYAPTNDVEQTIMDENGKRADHVIAGASVTIAEGDEFGKPTERGVRFGFVIVGDRDAVVAKELYEEQAIMAATQLIEHFQQAMRDIFGNDAVNAAASILFELTMEKKRVMLEMLAHRQSN